MDNRSRLSLIASEDFVWIIATIADGLGSSMAAQDVFNDLGGKPNLITGQSDM